MHEFSLVQTLLRQIDAIRCEQAAERVTAVRVSVGEFSGVEPDLFRDAFEILTAETPMREAELQMNRVTLECECHECSKLFGVERFRFECPKCKSRNVTIVRGQELVLESVTVEQDEANVDESNVGEPGGMASPTCDKV